MERWSVQIDIEGFSATYERDAQALSSLRALMEGIYHIGNRCYPDSPQRIFAHQLGDGFIIVSEFESESLEVPVNIAIALMRHVLFSGGVAKAVISEGDFADIQGCFPSCIRDAYRGAGWVRLGHGIMTTFPVMGTALIRAINLSKASPSGSLLIIRKAFQHRIPEEIRIVETDNPDLLAIDWIHAKHKSLADLQDQAGLPILNAPSLEIRLKNYIQANVLKPEWKQNTERWLGIE